MYFSKIKCNNININTFKKTILKVRKLFESKYNSINLYINITGDI